MEMGLGIVDGCAIGNDGSDREHDRFGTNSDVGQRRRGAERIGDQPGQHAGRYRRGSAAVDRRHHSATVRPAR